MPIRLNISMASMKAIPGRVRAGEAREIIDRLGMAVLGPERHHAGEDAERHGEVGRHEDRDALHARLVAGRERHQHVADVGDRGIGHQPLERALADGREGAEQHRGDRQEGDDLLPLVCDRRGKASIMTRVKSATAAIFGAPAKNAVTGVGAPS